MTSAPAPARMPFDVRLVIFDLDGVLVDTQYAENGALYHLAGLMGLSLGTAESSRLFSGRRLQECIDMLAVMSASPPPADAVAFVRTRCEEIIGQRLEPIGGVRAALERIPLDKCVASNSPLDIIQRRLGAAGIIHHFGGGLYSAYDVGSWKPDPGLFRCAARECGVDAENCLVVEDSKVGVDAALAAGMRVVQYSPQPGTMPHRQGVFVLCDMEQLPGLITRRVHIPPQAQEDEHDEGNQEDHGDRRGRHRAQSLP
jgi:HAD superfamily hydrolase (TIGR01509 family)